MITVKVAKRKPADITADNVPAGQAFYGSVNKYPYGLYLRIGGGAAVGVLKLDEPKHFWYDEKKDGSQITIHDYKPVDIEIEVFE